MMDASFVEAISKMADGTINEIEGVQFHMNHSKATPLVYPWPDTVELFSLTQVLSYLDPLAKALGDGDGRIVVNVTGHDSVELFNEKPNKNNDLAILARASFEGMFEKFEQSRYMDQEAFVIALMSKFQDSTARATLLRTVGKVKSGVQNTAEDDGFSQTVQVKDGVTLVKEETLQNLWILQPFKTFPEIEQPSVNYILRVQRGDTPKFALFEADGGMWKVATTKKVREWLVNAVKPALETLADKVIVL